MKAHTEFTIRLTTEGRVVRATAESV